MVAKKHLKLSFLRANIHRKQNLNKNDCTQAANFPTPTTPASGRGCYVLHASVRDHRGHHAWDQRGTDGGGQLLLGGEEILAGWPGREVGGQWRSRVLRLWDVFYLGGDYGRCSIEVKKWWYQQYYCKIKYEYSMTCHVCQWLLKPCLYQMYCGVSVWLVALASSKAWFPMKQCI